FFDTISLRDDHPIPNQALRRGRARYPIYGFKSSGGGRRVAQAVAVSYAWASSRQARSAWFGPTIWMPMGRPRASNPAGAASAGQPDMVTGSTPFIHS